MRVWTSIDEVSYTKKPERQGIISAKQRASRNWKELELADIAKLVGNQGHAFIPAHLVGGIKAENGTAMQLFALDFDGGVTFEQIWERCGKLGLAISFAYHTFSSTPEHEKFRIVFAHETVIEDLYIIKIALAMLMKIFPECDPACKNVDRMFLGGKELLYRDTEARFALVQLLPLFYAALDVNKHFKRNLESFCSKYKIMIVNNHAAMGDDRYLSLLNEIGDFVDSTIIHIIAGTTFPPFFIAEDKKLHQSITCRKKVKSLDISSSGDTCCELLNDFLEGKPVDHDGKFTILTNLMSINGGVKRFFAVLEKYYDTDTCQKWNRDYPYMKGYQPKRCDAGSCPYYHCCDNKGTLLDTLAADRKIYRRGKSYKTIGEATDCLKYDNLETAIERKGTGIHLIRAQTALGKTTAYIELIMEHADRKFIIAVPTNRLKSEVAQRLSIKIPEKDIFVTLSVDDDTGLISQEIKEQIAAFHKIGLHNKTKEILSEYLKTVRPEFEALRERVTKLIEGENAIDGERVIITTHAYLLQMSQDRLQDYEIIIDEDILYLQMLSNSNKVSLGLVNILNDKKVPGYSDIAMQILKAREGEYVKVNLNPYAVSLSEKQMEEYELWGDDDDNVNDLASAGAFMKKDGVVYYFCPQRLKPMKYIVMSATLNSHIYKLYFGKSMEIIEYPQVEAAYKGKLEQYSYHTLGRRSLAQHMEVFDLARKISGNDRIPIITFVKFEKEAGTEAKGLHFGNAAGCDVLKGKDIAIIGTPYKAEMAYKLVACYLGADVNNHMDTSPKPRRVDYNGNNFVIPTYWDALLREIQLYSLESELEQAIGRARLLRFDCTVYLFSSFPCEQAELRTVNYLL